MIHAAILENSGTDGDERAALNRALMGVSEEPVITGPLRYPKPGEIVRKLETVPVHEAIAALSARMPKGA